MKYDDAETCFLNFETELENEAGGTHAGMYLAWAALNGLLAEGFDRIDYFEFREASDLRRLGPGPADGEPRLFAAAWLGKTRLIDNG